MTRALRHRHNTFVDDGAVYWADTEAAVRAFHILSRLLQSTRD